MKPLWPAVVAACWMAGASASTVEADVAFDRAQAEYDNGHYALAVVHLLEAAAQGDDRSPPMLTLMYRMGERLYGNQVRADPTEAARWAALAAERYQATLTASAPQRP